MDLIDICVFCSVRRETISELDGAGVYVQLRFNERDSRGLETRIGTLRQGMINPSAKSLQRDQSMKCE